MPFQKGNKYGKGGARLGTGPKSKEVQEARAREAEHKRTAADAARAIIEKYADKLAERLVNDALKDEGRKSLHVAINKLISDAKQEVEHTGKIGVYRIDAFDPRNPERPRLINPPDDGQEEDE